MPKSGQDFWSLPNILGILLLVGTILGIVSIVVPSFLPASEIPVFVPKTFNVTSTPQHIFNFKELSIGQVDAGTEINGTVILFTGSSPSQPLWFLVVSQSDYDSFDSRNQRPYAYMVGQDNCTDYSFSLRAFIYKVNFTAKESTTYYVLANSYQTINMRADLTFRSYIPDPTWPQIKEVATVVAGVATAALFWYGLSKKSSAKKS